MSNRKYSDVIFNDEINIRTAGAGVYASDYSSHGNQQMRVVHTTHGDYIGYTTDLFVASYYLTEVALMKIFPDGSTKLLFRDLKPYGSCTHSLVCDNDGNVWSTILEENMWEEASNNRCHNFFGVTYRIDAETDKVRAFPAILDAPEVPNCAKTEICYDPSVNKIYVFTGRAASNRMSKEVWMIFDCTKEKWERKVYFFEQDFEYHYKYIYPDGKGGVILVDNRATTAEAVGFPESANDYGPTEEEWKTVTRHSASYVWDGLQMLYITDINARNTGCAITAVEADYSRAVGDQDYRYSLRGRYSNWYPAVNNNNGGDFFRDSKGHYHLIYNQSFIQAAGDRTVVDSSIWYHEVFDAADPHNMRRLSKKRLFADIEDQKQIASSSWRMTESTDGVLYIISGYSNVAQGHGGDHSLLRVYALEEIADGACEYDYVKLAEERFSGRPLVTISNNRGNCYSGDDIVDVIYKRPYGSGKNFENGYHDDYIFRRIKLPKAVK